MEFININENLFYKLKKLPIVSQREYVRLYKDDNGEEFIVKQLKRGEKGKELTKIKDYKEVEVLEKLIDAVNPSKYIVRYYQISQTDQYYFLRMEKCDGSLDDLFRENHIISLDSQVRLELIISLFYQIIQGYKYIKSLLPDFIHRDLCLDNILYKYVNGKYIALIAISRAIMVNYGLFEQFHLNRKFDYMPPEAIDNRHNGQFLDNIDVYTLGVCLYKMLFGLTSKVKCIECKLVLPIETQNDSYSTFLNLLGQMLEQNSMKRICWKQLYLQLYQFPQILSTKCSNDNEVTDCQNYFSQKLQQQFICLFDEQMKEIALEFYSLFRKMNLPDQQFLIITIMKYTFSLQLQKLQTASEEQFDENINKVRTGRYLVNLAVKIQLDFIQRGYKYQELLLDNEQQYQIFKTINQPSILVPFFKLFRKNILQQSRCNIF